MDSTYGFKDGFIDDHKEIHYVTLESTIATM